MTRLRTELAAPDLAPERIATVSQQIETATRRIAEIDAAVARIEAEDFGTRDVAAALADFDTVWTALRPKEQARIVRLVVQQVAYDGPSKQVEITFSDIGIATLAAETSTKQGDAA